MNDEYRVSTMITTNLDKINGKDTDNDIESPAKKKMRTDRNSIDIDATKYVNKAEEFDIQPQSLTQPLTKPPLTEFTDPVLLNRLKGTIKLTVQSSMSQAVLGLLNSVQKSMEENSQLKKMNFELERRVKKIESITAKVKELIPEKVSVICCLSSCTLTMMCYLYHVVFFKYFHFNIDVVFDVS